MISNIKNQRSKMNSNQKVLSFELGFDILTLIFDFNL